MKMESTIPLYIYPLAYRYYTLPTYVAKTLNILSPSNSFFFTLVYFSTQPLLHDAMPNTKC